MSSIFLSLGSNKGKKEEYLQKACKLLEENNVSILKKSSLYETEPLGKKNQEYFINQVIEVQTFLSVHELLDTIHNIEKKLGRIRGEKWGPQKIDIDILFYGNQAIQENDLTIPHPDFIKESLISFLLQK